jgi:hypothetical protein
MGYFPMLLIVDWKKGMILWEQMHEKHSYETRKKSLDFLFGNPASMYRIGSRLWQLTISSSFTRHKTQPTG